MRENLHKPSFSLPLASAAVLTGGCAATVVAALVLGLIDRTDLLAPMLLAGAGCLVIALLALAPIVIGARISPNHAVTGWLAATVLRLLASFGLAAALVAAKLADGRALALLLLWFYVVQLAIESTLVIRYLADRRLDWSQEAASC